MSLSNRLTQLRVYYIHNIRRCFPGGKKLQNGKTNKWQAVSKIEVTSDIFFHPPPAKENWSGNEIARVTRGLKRVNPLRLRYVMRCLHKNEMEDARSLFTLAHRIIRDFYSVTHHDVFCRFFIRIYHICGILCDDITELKNWIFKRAHLNKILWIIEKYLSDVKVNS